MFIFKLVQFYIDNNNNFQLKVKPLDIYLMKLVNREGWKKKKLTQVNTQ